MRVRKAALADAGEIARIHRAARRAAMPWLPVLHSAAEDLRFFQTRVLAEQAVWVAADEDRIIGFAAVSGEWLNHLYVDPGDWRRGVGSRLLARAKDGVARLQLWVFQDNQMARHFYAAHGFAEVELTDGAGNEEKTPDVRMLWTQRA
ncbi:GNAT family N-acetyltransferase [Paracoccus sp. SCSIO 75233]|uniref:GNAT family N-acetyltransferase n=1 Tax=Paracoccus sp. SCSIO 75233 TaxID=3017782 RepID=UPI0022F063F6|nr:GNAT family N-acetyltransferase [Paracoccus sp. SCSIO 75233]WBU54613.1 GNAT family N-acetyltransferase [Paracoccus sp. SCSIO 75233]